MKRLAATMMAGLAGLAAVAAPVSGSKPRLVVGIVVDQLRTDYVEQLRNLFGEKGFNTFMRDGLYMRDVDFGSAGLDVVSGTAEVLTGSWPAYTGVPGAMVYDSETSMMRPVLAAPSATGSYSNNSFSPEGLRLSTIADEMAIASDGKAQIYSVAADPQQAVILAGHAANGAVWVNNTSGLWASGSYYGSLPSVAQKANVRGALTHRVDTMQWRPLAATTRYIQASTGRAPQFSYKFARNDRDLYRKAVLTPGGNAAVTDMAVDLIGMLSPDASRPGMVNIGYTVAPYRFANGDAEAETTDAYLRLDAQIGRIIDAVDRYCGRENAVIWITSTGYYEAAATEDKKYRLPGGEFSERRAKSLLNSYLAARHGTADYVAAIRNGNIYLDNKAIEARNLSPEAVADEARQFVARMSGVERTFTRAEILSATNPITLALNRSYDPKTGADILIQLAPGWSMADDESAISTHNKPMRQMPVMTPAFILAPAVKAQTVSTPVDATAIAPTVAGILRIRSPNGARTRPLSF